MKAQQREQMVFDAAQRAGINTEGASVEMHAGRIYFQTADAVTVLVETRQAGVSCFFDDYAVDKSDLRFDIKVWFASADRYSITSHVFEKVGINADDFPETLKLVMECANALSNGVRELWFVKMELDRLRDCDKKQAMSSDEKADAIEKLLAAEKTRGSTIAEGWADKPEKTFEQLAAESDAARERLTAAQADVARISQEIHDFIGDRPAMSEADMEKFWSADLVHINDETATVLHPDTPSNVVHAFVFASPVQYSRVAKVRGSTISEGRAEKL